MTSFFFIFCQIVSKNEDEYSVKYLLIRKWGRWIQPCTTPLRAATGIYGFWTYDRSSYLVWCQHAQQWAKIGQLIVLINNLCSWSDCMITSKAKFTCRLSYGSVNEAGEFGQRLLKFKNFWRKKFLPKLRFFRILAHNVYRCTVLLTLIESRHIPKIKAHHTEKSALGKGNHHVFNVVKNVKKDWQLALQTMDNVQELRYNIGHANCQTIMTYYAVNNIARWW